MSSSSATTAFPVKPFSPRHDTWPYTSADFQRQDPSADASFYSSPRFVTHIDDHAIGQLKRYYAEALPKQGRILDFCSSWISHYPPVIEDAIKRGNLVVVGMGMNKAELDANPMLPTEETRVLRDLNGGAEIPDAVSQVGSETVQPGIDAATCVVSIDYLTRPVEILSSLRRLMKPGGVVHLAISNRCFPTKAVSRWLRVDEQERLYMVGNYLHFAGFKKIEIVDLSGSGEEGEEQTPTSSFATLMRSMGMGGYDPLWIVRGVKED
ncbi:MAG: hypothetical protein M1822_008939 [Bathelium mastoideum]|nr:MAG: hypothetical protein M1822_008939 [Bathelium mastoideum]